MSNIFDREKQFVAGTYARFPLEIVGGKGALLQGADGKEYIDLGAGIAVNTFGMADDEWVAAVTKQLNSYQHTSNLYYSDPCVTLAEMLCDRTDMKRVFFSNSGAEANECAIKAARKYSCERKGEDYYTIITLKNSFHGRTLTTLAATGQDAFHQTFLPLTDGFVHVEANNIDELRAAVSQYKCAAIMFEPVQGEGGVNPLNSEFVAEMARLAAENDLLLICDEVQTGNGRTGKLYGYMNFGIMPDVISTAKGLGGGLPIGATLLGEKVKDIFTPGTNGSTFGGNPVCCAGAVNILSRIDDALLQGVIERSQYIFDRLVSADGVESVTGLGLMIGIKTVKPAKEVVTRCLNNGVLVLTAKDKVRLLPPLNIDMKLLSQAIDVIIDACK